MSTPYDTCALCPRLCRHACPVATVWEPGAPSAIAEVLRDGALGRVDASLAQLAALACTDCGACQEACAIDRPVPELLRKFVPKVEVPTQLPPIAGTASEVAVCSGDRRWAEAFAAQTGRAVASWTPPANWHETDSKTFGELFSGRTAIVADGEDARALRGAGVVVVWLGDALGWVTEASCSSGRPALACCGGRGPLRDAHPEPAAALAQLWWARSGGQTLADARCRRALGRQDVVDQLLAGT